MWVCMGVQVYWLEWVCGCMSVNVYARVYGCAFGCMSVWECECMGYMGGGVICVYGCMGACMGVWACVLPQLHVYTDRCHNLT